MKPMGKVEATLVSAWRRRGPLASLLLPLGWIYSAVTQARRWLYRNGWLRSEAAGVPVIVVGNVVAGGAGKTPVVIELLRHLEARGVAAGVISRGHGRKLSRLLPDVREVLAGSSAAEVGDEPLLIQRATGAAVVVGRDRVRAAQQLLERHPQLRLIVSDDGLQHYRLRRDAEICVIGEGDAGNGWPLPAGPLRETDRQVDWILDASGGASSVETARPAARASGGRFSLQRQLADHALRADGRALPLTALVGRPLHAVAGIAHPDAFFNMLRDRGLDIASTEALPDHYDFDSYSGLPDQSLTLICTEKDAVKLWRTHPEALAVPLVVRIDPAFFAALDGWLDANLDARFADAPLS